MPLPVSLSLRTVTGKFLKGNGDPETGTVVFKRVSVLQSGAEDTFITPFTHTATLDNAGEFTIDLPVTDDVDWTPQNWAYEVTITVSAWQYRFNMLLEANVAPVDLADILPAGPVPDPPITYVPWSAVGEIGGPAGPLDGTGKLPVSQLPPLSSGVDSVNGLSGVVVLDAADVGADPAGTAASAIATHAGLADPHSQYALESGLSTVATTGAYADLTGKPTVPDSPDDIGAAPVVHTHAIGDTTGLQTALDGKAATGHTHTIANVTSLQTTLDSKAPVDSPTFTGTVSGVTKAHVGLGNVDNTSDANKPISTATQAALDAKVTGPGSSADNRIPRFSGTGGKTIDQSVVDIADTGDVSGIRALLRLVSADFGADYLDRLELGYVPTATDMELLRIYVQGTVVMWLDQIGYLRGTPHTSDKDNALVRGIPRGDLTTEEGGFLELRNSGNTQDLFKVDWRTGAVWHGNGTGAAVKTNPVLVLAAAASIPAGTPVGTVILREPA